MPYNPKQNFTTALNSHTDQKQLIHDDLMGKSLPCSVVAIDGVTNPSPTQKLNTAIVTVKFEVTDKGFPLVTMPVVMSHYLRQSVFIGMKGVAIKTNVYLGGVSGLGGGVGDVGLVGNLDGMVFLPIGNTDFVHVHWNMNYSGVAISDNAYNFTPTRLHDKSAKYIDDINELKDKLNQVINAVNSHIPTSIPLVSFTLTSGDNLTVAD